MVVSDPRLTSSRGFTLTSVERELQSIRAEMRRITGALPLLLTFKQAARELSVSLSKVKQMVRAGIIQTVRLEPNGHPRIPVAEVTRIAASKRPNGSNHGRSRQARVARGSGSAAREAVRTALRKGHLKDR